MANRLIIPNPQFVDGTGLPYAGGHLSFFATGTSTPQSTFSDSALTTPNANPVVLDSAGRAGSIFLSNLAYKVQLFDVNNVQIWSMDPVWSSDFSTVAQFAVNTGTPNGTVAGTAGTFGGLPSSVIWDSVNNILYVCTTTGTSSTAVWTAINAASTGAGVITIPGGRLTPTSGVPVIIGDVTSGSIFYTPYAGNQAPIFSGAAFTMQTFAEVGLSLNSSVQAANTIYDVFLFSSSGTPTLGTGPAWTNSAAGTGARGTGAGTSQLSLLQGIYVNTVQISAKNGLSTFTVPANQGTYVGSLQIDAAAGLVTCNASYGQSRKWGVWNAYNRKPITLRAGDGTASWTYGTNTWRASNGASANSLTIFAGLPEEIFPITFYQRTHVETNASSAQVEIRIGIGVNSTSAPTGVLGENAIQIGGSGTPNNYQDITTISRHVILPGIGISTITSLEICPILGTNTPVFSGTGTNMQLEASWNG